MTKSGNRATLTEKLEKALHCYPTVFKKFGKTEEHLANVKSVH